MIDYYEKHENQNQGSLKEFSKNKLETQEFELFGNNSEIKSGIQIANEFLNKICGLDVRIRLVMKNDAVRGHVISELSEEFGEICEEYPQLVEDIQERIVKYHISDVQGKKLTDFVQLVGWYKLALKESHPVDYWDPKGEYYSLRMNEVINMFLIARFNCGIV